MTARAVTALLHRAVLTSVGASALAMTATPALAEEGGFSYVMGIGRQGFRYEEKTTSLPVNSVGRSGGPLLVTGALYELPGGHMFSLDNETTFYPGPDNAVATPASTTVEETMSEVLANVGMALESGPLWRRVENTSQPQTTFKGTSGWDLAVAGRYSRAVMPHVHLGAWGKWAMSKRGVETRGPTLELPASRLHSLGAGLELLWKL